MAYLYPYLHFEGNCAEAMNFYKSVLGGKLDLMKAGDMPTESDPNKKEWIMHSSLTNEHITLMASDNMISNGQLPVGANVELCLSCENRAEVDRLFGLISAGGKIKVPVNETFFGSLGMCVDKFGINWIVQSGEKMQNK